MQTKFKKKLLELGVSQAALTRKLQYMYGATKWSESRVGRIVRGKIDPQGDTWIEILYAMSEIVGETVIFEDLK